MDRLIFKRLAGCGLGVIVMAAGCRSTPSPVPPGRQFSNEPGPAASFGSEPHPATSPNYGTVGGAPGSATPGLYGPAPTMPAGPAAASSPYGSAPMTAPYATAPSVGPDGGIPAASMPNYGTVPGMPAAGAGAPASAMDAAAGAAPAIPETLSGYPPMSNPQ
jgi:hypothetical protein